MAWVLPLAKIVVPAVIGEGVRQANRHRDTNLVNQMGEMKRQLLAAQSKHGQYVSEIQDKLNSLEQLGEEVKDLQKALQEANEREAIRLAELEKLRNYPPAPFQLTEFWKKGAPRTFHIGIVGASGTGKSTFINTGRGLRKRDKGAANVSHGVECTMEVKGYEHEVMHKGECFRIVYWDLPGGGTKHFPWKTYLRDFGICWFNFVIVLTVGRFMKGDDFLLKEMQEKNVPHAMVRNKIDQAITSAERDGDSVDATMYEIREDFRKKGVEKVFLISSPLAYFDKYDFPALRDYVSENAKVRIDEGIDFRVPQADFQDARAGAIIPFKSDHKPCSTCTIL